MTRVLGGTGAIELAIRQEPGWEGEVTMIAAGGGDGGHIRRRRHPRLCGRGQTGSRRERLPKIFNPPIGSRFVIRVAIDPRQEAFGSQLFEPGVKFFSSPAKIRIIFVSQRQHGEMKMLKLRGSE